MKKKTSLFLLVMLMLACLALLGCGQEKAANAPGTPSNQSGDSGTGNELAALMKSARQAEDGIYFETVNTINMQGQTNISQAKTWVSKGKVRSEAELAGVKSITISNGKDLWMYNEANNTAMKLSSLEAQDQDQLATKWAEDESSLDKMKIVGEESIDGQKCVVVTYKDAETESKMWLRKDIGMPAKIEGNVAGNKVLMEYKNYKLGAQDDNLFELPAGAQVVEMPTMPSTPAVP